MQRPVYLAVLLVVIATKLCAQSEPVVSQTNALIWDAPTKKHVETGTNLTHVFVFGVTNRSLSPVIISNVQPSCGCTVAKMPSQPWVLLAGQGGDITATVDFKGYIGLFAKLLHVHSSVGSQTLTMQIEVDPPKVRDPNQRQVDVDVSRNDRQAPFRGECARCHMIPALGKTGRQLYDAACGVCHDSSRRADFVPALKQNGRGQPLEARFSDPQSLREFIANGGPRLMPAFAVAKGGFLNDLQVEEIVKEIQGSDRKTLDQSGHARERLNQIHKPEHRPIQKQ